MSDEERQTTAANGSDRCSFCDEPAVWHFGTEAWRVTTAYVLGVLWVAGKPIDTCRRHGFELRQWASLQEQEALRFGPGAPGP